MPQPLVLDFDKSGISPNNLIENEVHVINETTGRMFALNYGGFYSQSVLIYKDGSATPLVPVIDYLCVAPNDAITQLTGLESMSVIVLTEEDPEEYEAEYTVTYQAVGAEYSTNVSAVRDVIQAIQDSVAQIHWGSILDKPEQFNTAPHLIDFRTQMYGFEGLIQSIQQVVEKLSVINEPQVAALMTVMQSGLEGYKTSVNAQLTLMQQQINVLADSIPNTSSFITGTPASPQQVINGTATNAFIRCSNMADIKNAVNSARVITDIANLNALTDVFMTGSFNLSAHGDSSVPNVTLPYLFITRSSSIVNNEPRYIQQAFCLDPNYPGMQLTRLRNLSSWSRADIHGLGSAAVLSVLPSNESHAWDDLTDSHLATPGTLKRVITDNPGAIVPIGTVVAYAAATIPSSITTWWRACWGQALSRTTEAKVFNVIGVAFGSGNGSTTFNLPDLRGEFIRGWSSTRVGIDTGRQFGSWRADTVGPHKHITGTTIDRIESSGYAPFGLSDTQAPGGDTTGADPSRPMPYTSSVDTIETAPRNVAMNFLIRVS